MRDSDGDARSWRAASLVAAVGLTVLAGCGRVERIEVSASSRPATSVIPPGPIVAFQGGVAAVDPGAGEFVVTVQIEWAPVVTEGSGNRRVVVDRRTRWNPPESGLGQLHVGDQVQVTAAGGRDGPWLAVEIAVVDVD